MPHLGLEPASALRLAFWSDALPTELPYRVENVPQQTARLKLQTETGGWKYVAYLVATTLCCCKSPVVTRTTYDCSGLISVAFSSAGTLLDY